MTIIERWRVAAATALATAAALALTACIVAPGTFQSTLDVRRDGEFTFTYEGEIYLIALSQLAEMANEADAANEEFLEQPCYSDEDFEERPCTDEEIADQRRTWEESVAARKAAAERDSEAMKAMLGGIDPADPEAAEELAERLRRQEGWKRVEYRGDGLFEVEFALTSRIGHDFSFPTFERFPMSNSFVVANLRQGRTVRIEAPGFATQGGGNPFQGMMTGMAGVFGAASVAESGNPGPKLPETNGTFRIVTDGHILANNTDEGPRAEAGGQVLEWEINRRTLAPPMALIQLGG
ncbi:MAG TPA: hypothetical protein VEB68_12740 [Croceibacterium sp.]|nr:hypothetical protein [Propylenella sp.]HYD25653.1 hypothetical protein [Croceibacterium sp.]